MFDYAFNMSDLAAKSCYLASILLDLASKKLPKSAKKAHF